MHINGIFQQWLQSHCELLGLPKVFEPKLEDRKLEKCIRNYKVLSETRIILVSNIFVSFLI